MSRRRRVSTIQQRRLELEYRKWVVLTIVNTVLSVVATIAAVLVAIFGQK